MKTIIVDDFVRPSYNSGTWTAVKFTTKEPVLGQHQSLRLMWAKNSCELWEFFSVLVMILENKTYVLTYDKFQRVCRDI